MEKDLLALISEASPSFSKGQRQIAKYITENYDKAAFMTAGKLGKTVGVSESTVVRFAAELGYDGYPGMRKALQDMIRNRLTSVQRIEVAKGMIDDSNVLKAVLGADIEKLQTTLSEVDQDSFDAAVAAILGAKNIYIVGMRSSTSLASFMGFYLNLILDNVHLIHDTSVSEVYEQIFRIGPEDVFIGISYPRYSSRTVKAMQFTKSTGATVIGITDGPSSPFVGLADVNLFAKSDMVSFLDSLVAPMSLINALIVSIGIRHSDALSDTFSKLEGIWSEYDVYENNSEY
jgi:DNA-binding MurR/RpiR family transcriptional regulator